MAKIKSKLADTSSDSKAVRSIFNAIPVNHGALGKRIELGSKTHITKNKAGMKIEFFTPTIEVLIGIGKDHVAYLLMDEDAWNALNKGQKLDVETITTFKKKFL